VEQAVRLAAADIARAPQVDTRWVSDAACRDVPPSTSAAMVAACNEEEGEVLGWRCDGCPVAYECLSLAMDLRASGLWGGFVLVDGKAAMEPQTMEESAA
jgi:hypothetical protein